MSNGGLALVWLGWLVCQPTPLDEPGASLEARIAALLPHPDEDAWRRIPWRSDLLVVRPDRKIPHRIAVLICHTFRPLPELRSCPLCAAPMRWAPRGPS